MSRNHPIRRLALVLNIVLLLCALLMWNRSESKLDGYYHVRYFRHISPQWFFLQGIESGDGRLMFVESYTTCLTAAEATVTSSDWDDLGLERTDVRTGNITTISVWRTKQVVYGLNPHTFWNRLGFYDSWQLGYKNPTWGRRGAMPYVALIIPLSLWPAIALCGVLLRRTRQTRADRRRAKGLCPDCGYDLRATPDRCPECGVAAASSPIAP